MSPADVLRTPNTAWPTIVVALLAVLMQATAVIGLARGTLPWALAAAMSFVAAFASFTPMHDASHRSVSRNRLLNDWIGRLSSVVLLAPYAAFRYVHLEHHKHTNHPDRDPDFYAGRGPKWLLPLRWLTQDLHYYVVILGRWRQRPRGQRIELVVAVTVFVALLGSLVGLGHGTAALLAWIVPTRLAIAALALSFDYLPHVPHRVLASEDRFAATRIIVAPGLTGLFLFQNYHLIHHLYPGVPFYRYKRVFDAQRESLLAKGAEVWRWPPAKPANPPRPELSETTSVA